jgi:hypothetical protein
MCVNMAHLHLTHLKIGSVHLWVLVKYIAALRRAYIMGQRIHSNCADHIHHNWGLKVYNLSFYVSLYSVGLMCLGDDLDDRIEYVFIIHAAQFWPHELDSYILLYVSPLKESITTMKHKLSL